VFTTRALYESTFTLPYLTYRHAILLRHYVRHRRSGLATSVWISHTCRQYASVIVTCDLDPMSDLHSTILQRYQRIKNIITPHSRVVIVSRSIGIQKSRFFSFCELELDPMAFKRYNITNTHTHKDRQKDRCDQMYIITATFSGSNKKLRYREEHSASVVLSWCTFICRQSTDQQLINHF